jgi:hypothetical protein
VGRRHSAPCRRHGATEKPTFLYADDMSCLPHSSLCSKTFQNDKIRDSRRTSAHAAITIMNHEQAMELVFWGWCMKASISLHALFYLVLATFEKTFEGDQVGLS